MFCTVLFIRTVHFCVNHLLFSPKCRIIYYRYFRLWKNLYRYQKNGVEGRSPQQGLGAVAPHSAPARMPSVYAQGLCTMQSQPSIHSLSPRGKGFGVRDREFALSYKIQTFSTNLRHRISGAFVVIIDLFILSSSALKLCKAQGMILLYHSMYHEDLCRIRRA